MEIVFENRKINSTQSGFSSMRDFLMGRNPGAFGAMLGKHGELELPTPVFLDALRMGLAQGDYDALEFRYRSVADLIGSRRARIWYDREGWPMVTMSGDVFPNTRVTYDMAFLKNGSMAWDGYVFSDRLVLPFWKRGDLEKLTREGMKLDTSGFYPPIADAPDIKDQLHRYPDLTKILIELRDRKEDPVVEKLEDIVETLGGDWSIHTDFPPSEAQRRVMERYQVFRYIAEIHCFVPTLNQMVEETKTLVPLVEETYVAARDRVAEG